MTPSTRRRAPRRSSRDASTHPFICAACGATISDRSALRILRNDETPAECDAVDFVHAGCTASFVEDRSSEWTIYRADSPEAAWFLPVMVHWP